MIRSMRRKNIYNGDWKDLWQCRREALLKDAIEKLDARIHLQLLMLVFKPCLKHWSVTRVIGLHYWRTPGIYFSQRTVLGLRHTKRYKALFTCTCFHFYSHYKHRRILYPHFVASEPKNLSTCNKRCTPSNLKHIILH